nr:clavaminate synthase-like protein At3g21360 [Quercus suber]
MSETFLESQIPHQKLFNGIQFPLVLSPNPKSQTPPSSLSLFTQAIKTEKTFLDSVLHKSGAVLLRGFPVNTASDFNDVVEAFGFEELPYVGGAAPRSNVVGRVFTTNDSPPDQKVPFHHEMAQVYSVISSPFLGQLLLSFYIEGVVVFILILVQSLYTVCRFTMWTTCRL